MNAFATLKTTGSNCNDGLLWMAAVRREAWPRPCVVFRGRLMKYASQRSPGSLDKRCDGYFCVGAKNRKGRELVMERRQGARWMDTYVAAGWSTAAAWVFRRTFLTRGSPPSVLTMSLAFFAGDRG